MDEVPVVLTKQLLRLPTENVAIRRVHQNEIPGEVDDRHQVRRDPEELLETDVGDLAATHW